MTEFIPSVLLEGLHSHIARLSFLPQPSLSSLPAYSVTLVLLGFQFISLYLILKLIYSVMRCVFLCAEYQMNEHTTPLHEINDFTKQSKQWGMVLIPFSHDIVTEFQYSTAEHGALIKEGGEVN